MEFKKILGGAAFFQLLAVAFGLWCWTRGLGTSVDVMSAPGVALGVLQLIVALMFALAFLDRYEARSNGLRA